MKSTISSTKIVAALLCGTGLVACDSIKSVSEEPTYAVPREKVVLNGTVTGVGATRPVKLQITVTGNGENSGTRELSIRDTEVLRFGGVDVGAGYEVTILESPFGRDCTIANGTGVATAPVNNITVTCVRDATPLYTVTASIAPALANSPPEGFAVTLQTEEGVETVYPEVGQTSVTFENPVLYPGGNPPAFTYQVTATNTRGGTLNNCAVTNGSGALASEPPANITNVSVTGCLFTIAATVDYSAPPGGAPAAMGANGVQLGLRNVAEEIVAETAVINAFGPAPVAFPGTWVANSSALYEVVVLQHPAGQFCIVGNGGRASLVPTSSVPNPANVTATVRCRNVPAEANRLKGAYQLQPPANSNTTGLPVTDAQAEMRNFLTFFENGTFIYGTHHSSTAAGVEHGFYNYNPGAGTLGFTIWTDSNGLGAVPFGSFTGVTPVNYNEGLSGRANHALTFNLSNFTWVAPGNVTATNVVRTPGAPGTPGTLSLTFGTQSPPGTPPPANYNPVWQMVEPVNTPGQVQGVWTTADSKRVFIYNRDTTYGFHAGVNGAPNLQDACFTIETPSLASSFYTRRGGDTGCMSETDLPDEPRLVSTGTVDVPSGSALIPGFVGRLPGSQSNAVVVPSPVYYDVEAGVGGQPETLTLQATLNDVPIRNPIVFYRTTTY